jgi:serine protease AprX
MMAVITINGISIDPQAQAPALARANLALSNAASSNFILVQVSGPLTRDQRNALQAQGATILEYVPDNTYICNFPQDNLAPIRNLPFVTWANVYLMGFKLPTALRPGASARSGANLLALPPVDTLAKDRVTVDVVLQKGISADAIRDQVAAAAGLDPQELNVARHKIRLSIERRRLNDLAKIDEVRHIEPYVPPHFTNNIARDILTAGIAQATGTMQGEGQIVAVCDTGFDQGSTSNVHPAFIGRVMKLYPLGRNTASDPDGHGTHVCGSVLGDGQMNDGTVVRGTAPKARLVVQSVLDPGGNLGGLPVDLHDLFIDPYQQDEARVHSNSWGSADSGAYKTSSNDVDDFVWNHRDLVICFAAGNDGVDSQGRGVVDPGSVGSPGTAKNCITVGASENLRSNFSFPGANHPSSYGDGWASDFPADPIHSDPVANNAEGMVAFSSRGPASNNRVRPDVVAPGTAILSTRSRAATGSGWGRSSDPLYFYDGGTSMATPLVAGCAAVVRQFLQLNGIATPSAALVKGMLINGAAVLTGQYIPPEVGAPPDISQGFGRVDLAATVGPYSPTTTVSYKDEATALDTGATEHTAAQINNAGRTLKVTLAWTDMPGEALQNDLDLIVTSSDGRVFHGNRPAGATDFDRTNNVEQVVISNVPQGSADIEVLAFRATQPQSYALVIRVS